MNINTQTAQRRRVAGANRGAFGIGAAGGGRGIGFSLSVVKDELWSLAKCTTPLEKRRPPRNLVDGSPHVRRH
jgi:hypothetical protein